MKKKAFVGLALAAALAMGVTPAFGATDVPNTSTNTSLGSLTDAANDADGGSASGSTTVSVKTVAMNITAQVPITMTIAAPAEGGALTVPNGYKITNGSIYPIAVKAKADMTDAKWSLTSETASSLEANKINLKLQPAGVATAFSISETESAEWKIDKKTANATECVIALTGTAAKTGLEVGATTRAMKLVYTIAPTTIPAP